MERLTEKLKNVIISGREVLPIVEGGKGIAATSGKTAGAFAAGAFAAGAAGAAAGQAAKSIVRTASNANKYFFCIETPYD